MKTWIAAVVLLLAAFALPAWAQTAENGDPLSVEEAFYAIQAAVGDDEAETVANWISYPFTVTIDGEDYVFDGADAVLEHYDSMMTDEIKNAVAAQKFEDLFMNAEGFMFGNGQMWISEICRTDDCAESDVRIITIQSTAQ